MAGYIGRMRDALAEAQRRGLVRDDEERSLKAGIVPSNVLTLGSGDAGTVRILLGIGWMEYRSAPLDDGTIEGFVFSPDGTNEFRLDTRERLTNLTIASGSTGATADIVDQLGDAVAVDLGGSEVYRSGLRCTPSRSRGALSAGSHYTISADGLQITFDEAVDEYVDPSDPTIPTILIAVAYRKVVPA